MWDNENEENNREEGQEIIDTTGIETEEGQATEEEIRETGLVQQSPSEVTPYESEDTSNNISPYEVNYNYSSISEDEREQKRRELAARRAAKRENKNNMTNQGMPNGKKGSGAKGFLAVAGAAILFGLVAGVCFQGVSYLFDMTKQISSSKRTTGPIATTAPIAQATQAPKQDEKEKTTEGNSQMMDVSAVVDNTMPAIVSITSTVEAQGGYSIFGQYYGGGEYPSSGSGIVVAQNDKELLVATNNHVIEDAKKISVQFIDEEVYDAEVKGTDSTADLAVVAIKISSLKNSTKEKIKVATLGDSSKIKVGEMAIAIGNALGYGQSVTVGYISAKDREVTVSDSYLDSGNKMTLLQTDAAINPGNSGGALLNMQGEVIGINSVKYASEEVEGMGYAIPISIATPIIDELVQYEKLKESEKGYLGISGKTVTEAASSYNIPQGVYVDAVSKDGAAKKAGILEGDIITKINDISVTTMEALQERVTSYKKGTEIKVTLMRASNGQYKEQTLTVKLQGKESVSSLEGSTDNKKSNQDGSSGNNSDEGSNNGNSKGNSGNGNGGSGNGGYGYYDDYNDFFTNPFSDWFN